jgi:hypothetical protein
MKRKHVLLVGALTLATLLVSGIVLAQDEGPQSPSHPADALTTGFTYQGRLDKDGSPVNDACDMRFKLYDAASAGTEVGSDPHAGVPVTDGLFSVNLDFGADAFSGDRRWLGIEVDCEEDSTYDDLGRQELTAAPYALSLKPGAVVSGTVDSVAMLSAYNSGSGYGLLGLSGSGFGVAGQSNSSYGVYAYSDSGYGMYAYGGAGDLRLYDGTIYANMWSSSDLKLHSNDNVDVHLDDDSNSVSQFRVLNDANTAVFTVDEIGSVASITDTQIAASPLNMAVYYVNSGTIELRPAGYILRLRRSFRLRACRPSQRAVRNPHQTEKRPGVLQVRQQLKLYHVDSSALCYRFRGVHRTDL